MEIYKKDQATPEAEQTVPEVTSKAEDVVMPQGQTNRTLKQNPVLRKWSSVIWKLYMTELVSQISSERLDYSINSAGAIGYLCGGRNESLPHTIFLKINFKDLNVKCKTLEFVEENTRFLWPSGSKWLFKVRT